MVFEELNGGDCRTYLIASEQSGEAMIVDPLFSGIERYQQLVADRGLTLRYVLDTHGHADHLSGALLLSERTGATTLAHEAAASAAARRVRDGETLQLGDLPIRFLHTPGHTRDSLTLQLPDRLLTGDFLFLGEGGAGRTDLPGGDAGEHWDSLQKLRDLPDGMLVFPAHDYHGRTHSTLGEERRANDRLSRSWERTAYVDWLHAQAAETPDWMRAVVQANAAGVRDASAVHIPAGRSVCESRGGLSAEELRQVRTLPPDTLARELGTRDRPLVVDVRSPEECRGELGHIPGAFNVPLPDLERSVGSLDALKSRPVVTVCRSGLRSAKAALLLSRAGFEHVRSLEGGMVRWSAERRPTTQSAPKKEEPWNAHV